MRSFLMCGAVFLMSACGMESQPTSRDFEVGSAEDPIVLSARQALAGETDTVTITLSNTTNYDIKDGLITFSPLVTTGKVPSAAVLGYLKGSARSNADKLIDALGLTEGTNAFIIKNMNKKSSRTLTFTVPSGTKLSYLVNLNTNSVYFMAASDLGLVGGFPGTAASQGLLAHSLNSNNVVTLGGPSGTPDQSKLSVTNQSDCAAGLAGQQVLFQDDFKEGANTAEWPKGSSWDGEFGGDWYTDGITARVWNPNWGGADPSAALPTVTGIWKFGELCPGAGSSLNITSKLATSYTSRSSDTTLVLYFFDRGGNLVSVTTNSPLKGVNDRGFALYDAAIPATARRYAIAPMARLEQDEKGGIFYDSLQVDYEAAGTVTTLYSEKDDFSSYGKSIYGANQPTGWTEFGGDWYAMPTEKWATLGPIAGADTGMTKTWSSTVPISGGYLASVRLFVASTFTDPTSFVRLRLTIDGSKTFYDSERLGFGYGYLDLRRVEIPEGAKSGTLVINAYAGPKETSSLYVDDLTIQVQQWGK